MAAFSFFGAIENARSERTYLFSDEMGIEVCPYFFSDDTVENELGLLKGYKTSSLSAFAEDIALQTLVNPLVTFVGNLFLAVYLTGMLAHSLYRSLVTTIGLDELDKDETPLVYAASALIGIPYLLVHTVLDPAWELLAAITRPLSTLGAGIINTAQACADYCTSEDESYPRGPQGV